MDFGLLTHNTEAKAVTVGHCWSDCTAALACNYSASTFYCHTACSQVLGPQLEHCHSLYKCDITKAQGQHMPQPLCTPVCIRQNAFFQPEPRCSMCSSNGSVAAPHSPVPNRKGQDLKSPGMHIIPLLEEFVCGQTFGQKIGHVLSMSPSHQVCNLVTHLK